MKSNPANPEVPVVAVAESGWSVVANLIGPLPELHRGGFHDTGPNRRFVTDCDLVGRHVIDLPIGTNARLCPECLLIQAIKRKRVKS
jgi:hypothetical protein